MRAKVNRKRENAVALRPSSKQRDGVVNIGLWCQSSSWYTVLSTPVFLAQKPQRLSTPVQLEWTVVTHSFLNNWLHWQYACVPLVLHREI